MKKALSIVLSVLIVVIGIAPAAFAVYKPGVAMRVTKGAYTGEPQDIGTVKENVFTMVVKMPAVTNLVEAGFYMEFDDSVLKVLNVADEGQAYTVDKEENKTIFFNGQFASNMKTDSTTEYSFGIMSSSGISKNAAKDFVYVTFQVLDTTKTNTTVNLYTSWFVTDDKDDTNDVRSTTLIESKIVDFDFTGYVPPVTKPVVTSTDAPDVDDINDLIQLIKDVLKGNGATWADVADAVANILGNADIFDMIEQLIGGDIGGGFLDKLKDIGLDFGALEDILNKIIDFIKNLFDNGGDTTKPASTTTTNPYGDDTTGNPATTQNGSQSGSEDTGDLGIALAVTVCVAGASVFALTRKKKED